MKALILFVAIVACTIFNTNAGTDTLAVQKSYYIAAKQELEAMLSGKQSASYERAIFLIENAWYENRLDYPSYTRSLDLSERLIRNIMAHKRDSLLSNPQRDMFETVDQKKQKYEKALANYAIYNFITEPAVFSLDSSLIFHVAYQYTTADPMASMDWSNTQVTHLLGSNTGNCFALASLFEIFSQRLNCGATLCTAPGHIYIRHADNKGTRYNVDLGSHSFPGTGTLATLTYSTDDAIRNNVALRELTLEQSITLCLVYLAKGYEHKFRSEDDDFLLACANTALIYDKQSLNAMLLKAEALEQRILQQHRNIDMLQGDSIFSEYQALIGHLYDLGYREMSTEMKNILIAGWTKDSTVIITQDHTQNTFEHIDRNYDRTFTLSNGVFDEVHTIKPIEQFGQTLFDTKTKTITGFTQQDPLYNNYNFDPVAFAWNIDPLAHKFPYASPYSFCDNNPILKMDPDGAQGMIYLVVLPNSGFTSAQVATIIKVSNAAFISMGLTTRMALLPCDPNDFKTFNLDHTDAVAAIGHHQDVVDFYNVFNSSFSRNTHYQMGEGNGVPEVGERGGYCIGIDADYVKKWGKALNTDPSTAAAFAILHAAGHNADANNINHSEGDDKALRWGGDHVAAAITGETFADENNVIHGWAKEQGVNSLGALMNNLPLRGTPRNAGYVGIMQSRFGTAPAQDNYKRNDKMVQWYSNFSGYSPSNGMRR